MIHDYIIEGRPISKKNSKMWVNVGYRRKLLPSKAYLNYEQDALWQLKQQRSKASFVRIEGVCALYVTFYIRGKYHVDLDNMVSSICDIVQKARLIHDDDQIIKIVATKVGGCASWSTKFKLVSLGGEDGENDC